MALVAGGTTTDWARVSLDLSNVQANVETAATRFVGALSEIQTGNFTVDQNSATLLSMTLTSGGEVTFTGTGLDKNHPTSRPIVKTFHYTNPNTGEVVSLTGALDFAGREVVTSLTIGFAGSEQTLTGNLSVNPVSGLISGRLRQLQVMQGTTKVTINGLLTVGGNFTVRGTVRELSVVDDTNTITMTGLVLPYSALASVTTVADLFTVVGDQRAGDDTIVYANNSGIGMTVHGGGGNDIITIKGPNGDRLEGGAGNDQLTGGAGNDTLLGQGGADRLDGGAGNDVMDGGVGNDTYIVDSVNDTAAESMAGAAGGVDIVESTVDVTLGQNIENLILTGTGNISGTGNTLNNSLIGNSGNNSLSGSAGNDTLVGGEGHDALDGGHGRDVLKGGLGNDSYTVDLAKVGAGAKAKVKLEDTITEGREQGTDTVILRGVVSDLVKVTTLTLGTNLEQLDASQTGTTKLNLKGNVLSNTLTGNDADNVLTGLAGNDTLNGGAGNDVLDGGIGQDTITGGAGNDQIMMLVTAGHVDTIDAGADTDMLILSGVVPGDHVVMVNLASLTDQVVSIGGVVEGLAQTNCESLDASRLGGSVSVGGSDRANIIIGSKGNDSLAGGAGNDTLIGGPGNDHYTFGYGDGQDLIQEHRGEDLLGEDRGAADRLSFNRGLTVIDPADLIVSRQADDLRIALQGSTDQVTIQNWYKGGGTRIGMIEAGTGDVLRSSQVEKLIQAMAQFTTKTGLSWEMAASGAGTAGQQTQYQNIIAENWQ